MEKVNCRTDMSPVARMRVPKFASRQLVFSGLILGRMMVCLDAKSAV
jgi:hypothetical protein